MNEALGPPWRRSPTPGSSLGRVNARGPGLATGPVDTLRALPSPAAHARHDAGQRPDAAACYLQRGCNIGPSLLRPQGEAMTCGGSLQNPGRTRTLTALAARVTDVRIGSGWTNSPSRSSLNSTARP